MQDLKNQFTMTGITVAKGDGIGPEMMHAVLKVILAAGAKIEMDFIEVGKKVYLAGNTAGIAPEVRDTFGEQIFFRRSHYYTERWWLQKPEYYHS